MTYPPLFPNSLYLKHKWYNYLAITLQTILYVISILYIIWLYYQLNTPVSEIRTDIPEGLRVTAFVGRGLLDLLQIALIPFLVVLVPPTLYKLVLDLCIGPIWKQTTIPKPGNSAEENN